MKEDDANYLGPSCFIHGIVVPWVGFVRDLLCLRPSSIEFDVPRNSMFWPGL